VGVQDSLFNPGMDFNMIITGSPHKVNLYIPIRIGKSGFSDGKSRIWNGTFWHSP